MPAHIGDVGTAIVVTVKDQNGVIVDISGATVRTIYLLKPDGTTLLTRPASNVTDGKDGRMQYITVAADFDMAGTWKAQGYVEIGAGKWDADVVVFTVKGNLHS